MSPRELFEHISSASPSFAAVRSEHLLDSSELLPHVLMGKLVRYVGAYFGKERSPAPASLMELQAVLALLDQAAQSGNSETVNALAVSFVEHIETEPFFPSLEPLLGPALRAEFKSQQEWYARRPH